MQRIQKAWKAMKALAGVRLSRKGMAKGLQKGISSRVRDLTSQVSAKRLEQVFLPSNVVIMFLLLLSSYIFIFGPGVHPTINTMILFVLSMSCSFAIMEWVKKHAKDESTHNILQLRVSLVALLVTLIIMHSIGLPQPFVLVTITLLILSPFMFAIRSKWKISGHLCTYTAMATIMTIISGWFAPLFFLIPVISWSRLKLKAHTFGQVVAGTIVGFVVPWAIAVLIFV